MSDHDDHHTLRDRMSGLSEDSRASELPVPWPHISHRFIDLLPEREQAEWQATEYWTYANDGERPATDWGDGPCYLGLSLVDWMALGDKSPRIIEICGMQGAINRRRFNHPDPEQRRRWLEQHEGPIDSIPF